MKLVDMAKAAAAGTFFALWEYWLGKTKKIIANSSVELLLCLWRRLTKGRPNMSFKKVIPIGEAGSIEIKEEAGQASIKIEVAQNLGGGAMAGVLKAKAGAEVDVDAKLLIDAGFELAAHKFPGAAALILAAKAAVDAQLAKA